MKELDEQHHCLFEIFYTLLEDEETTSNRANALVNLRAYTYEHLKREEEYMVECDYPDLGSHKRMHNAFRKKVEMFCSVGPEKQKENLVEILSSLYEWLITHIGSCDQRYVPYMIAQMTDSI